MNAIATQPAAGEIWLARFVFEEGTAYKIRPVLVLETTPIGTKVAFCGTQKLDETSSRTDVLLSDEEAKRLGLYRATRICLGKRRVIARPDMLKRLGELGTPGVNLSTAKFREIAMAAQAAGAL